MADQERTPRTPKYRMIYVGRDREWTALEGCEAPEGLISEIRSVPGNIVAWGHSRAQALERLEESINYACLKAGGKRVWYESAVAGMTEDEKAEARALAAYLFWCRDRAETENDHPPVVEADADKDEFCLA